MLIDVLVIVIVTSFVQSIFGVGVLLFGTPLLLIQGYEFVDALMVLLPISTLINSIQIATHYRSIDFRFYKRILVYTIPFVILFLFLVIRVQINIGLIIGAFLILVAVKDWSAKIGDAVAFLIKYEKAYFVSMGIVHGLTNLGGSLLTAIAHSKNYEKDVTRVTVAVSYATFAVFQMLTLGLGGYRIDFKISGIGGYAVAGLAVFFVTERLIYVDIDNRAYSKYFAVFLFSSGLLLCARSL